MKLWSLAIDFKSAPLELRARAFQKGPDFAKKIAGIADEYVFLSTCNRVELYAAGGTHEQSQKYWQEICGLSESDSKCFQTKHEREMLLHLFRVASSMESMVVGESQILGQVKKAYEDANLEQSIGPLFHRCFQRAFKVAKRVRSQTEVGRLAVSIPSIGVKLAEKVVGELSQKTIGIVGLGEMGRLSAEYFASVLPKKILLFNRTASVASDLARNLQIEGIAAEAVSSLEALLEQVDVLVSAVDGVIFKQDHLKKLDSRQSAVFILDLSVPSSLEPYSFKDCYLYSIDDLRKIAEENNRLREQEVLRAEEILKSEADSCWTSLTSLSAAKTIENLTAKADRLTESELHQLREPLKHLSPEDWAAIEKMAARLTHKVLQDPIAELRSLMESADESEPVIRFFRDLFRI